MLAVNLPVKGLLLPVLLLSLSALPVALSLLPPLLADLIAGSRLARKDSGGS
jgi:hypothetical protein